MNTEQKTDPPVSNKENTKKTPGKVLGIVSIIIGIVFLPLVGLILAIISFRISKKASYKNNFAKVGIWLNSIILVWQIALLVTIAALIMLPTNKARETTSTFNSAVVSGDCNKVVGLMTPAGGPVQDSDIQICKQMKTDFGTSQKEVASAVVDGKRIFVYSIEGGTKKFLKIITSNDRIIFMAVYDTQPDLELPQANANQP